MHCNSLEAFLGTDLLDSTEYRFAATENYTPENEDFTLVPLKPRTIQGRIHELVKGYYSMFGFSYNETDSDEDNESSTLLFDKEKQRILATLSRFGPVGIQQLKVTANHWGG